MAALAGVRDHEPRLHYRGRELDADRLAGVAFAVALLITFAYLMWLTRQNTFFYDDWNWIFTRRSGIGSILDSYNQHMLIGTLALWQLLFHTVGLSHHWPYQLLGTCAHLALAAAIFVFARRRIGWLALPLLLPFLVLGEGWEYVLWPINIGFVTSLTLGLCARLALEGERPGHDWIACVLLCAGLLASELVLTFAVGLAVELTWRDRSLRRAYVWFIPMALFALWWAFYFQPGAIGSPIGGIPNFAADLAAAAAGGYLGLNLSWGQPLLIAGMVLALVRLSRSRPLPPGVGGLATTACAYWLLVSYGRNASPDAPRYIYVGTVLLMLLVAECARGLHLSARTAVIGSLAALFALVGNFHALKAGNAELHTGTQTIEAEFAAIRIEQRFAPQALLIDPHYLPGHTVGQYLATVRALHSSPADSLRRLEVAPEFARSAADLLLVHGDDLQIQPQTSAGIPRTGQANVSSSSGVPPDVLFTVAARASHVGSCTYFRSSGPGATIDLALTSAGLRARETGAGSIEIYARRFEAGFDDPPVAALAAGKTISFRAAPDGVGRAWVLRFSVPESLVACTGG